MKEVISMTSYWIIKGVDIDFENRYEAECYARRHGYAYITRVIPSIWFDGEDEEYDVKVD